MQAAQTLDPAAALARLGVVLRFRGGFLADRAARETQPEASLIQGANEENPRVNKPQMRQPRAAFVQWFALPNYQWGS